MSGFGRRLQQAVGTSTLAPTVSDPPTGVTATAGDTEAMVSWIAPVNDGGTAITGYTVTSNPGNLTATTSGATTTTVTGLSNGTAYTFTVVATNAQGDSIPSTASNSVTPSTSSQFATDFTGATLPTGWAFDDPLGVGSYTMVGDRLRLTVPANSYHDSIYHSNSTGDSFADNTVGVQKTVSDQDFDIAVELGTDIHSIRGLGLEIGVVGSGTDRIRASWYTKAANNGTPVDFCMFEFCASAVGSSVTNATSTNSQVTTWFSGTPAWMRLQRAGSTWTLYGSADSVTWTQIRQWTATITVNALRLGVLQTTTTGGFAMDMDIFRVVDLLVTPDPRPTVTKTTPANDMSTDFSSGSLPAWLTTSTGSGGGTVTVTGSPLRLRLIQDPSVDQQWAAVGYNGTPSTDQGLLLKYQFVSEASSPDRTSFLTPGIVSQGADPDQYAPFGGNAYDIELNGRDNIHREVRRVSRTEPNLYTLPDGFEDGYTHLTEATDNDNTGAWWVRLEYVDGHFRTKQWQDGTSEPSTWLFDGADRIAAGSGVQGVSWSHNFPPTGTTSNNDTADIFYFERYDLT
ncbi:MAG TPA: fibronectin type III domain-containing protein [Candidatus Saccharimonadales bacterium]|nr:fibronectin type III domain-containing protein [Candidatus Saccharimonadales bacterium]